MQKSIKIIIAFIGASMLTANLSGAVINVKDFGAVPNDNKNDSEAIQKAIIEAEKQGGGTVYVPSGTYLIDKPVQINKTGVIFTGDGYGTELRNNGCSGAVIMSVASMRKPSKSIDNVIISKLRINGVDKSVSGIMASGLTRGSSIEDNYIKNCKDAIHLVGCWSFSIVNNNINNCADSGLKLGVSDDKAMVYISKVVNAVKISANTVRGCKYGLLFNGGNGWNLDANTFELNEINAHLMNTECGAITGNYFEASKSDNSLLILGKLKGGIVKNLTIGGNMFYQCSPKSKKYQQNIIAAIELRGAICCDISANRYSTGTQPIKMTGPWQRVFNNKIFWVTAPKSAKSYGVPGMIVYNKDYIYYCIAKNVWKRIKMEKSF